MTVKEVNEKLCDIGQAIDDIYRHFPRDERYYYDVRPEPKPVQLLREYAEMLEGLEVKVGGNV